MFSSVLLECEEVTAKEHLIDRLRALVKREPGGADAVALKADVSAESLKQIVAGTQLPSGSPRGVGPLVQRKLDAAFPGWSGLGTRSRYVVGENQAEYAGRPAITRRVPVIGEARMGADGFYEETQPSIDGSIDSYSSDPDAYALRLKGDSMHPAIRHGSFVVVEPNGRCTPGEYVALQLRDGRKMVKELIIERHDEVVVESVNGNARQTIPRSDIESMHPVAAVVAASKWRPA